MVDGTQVRCVGKQMLATAIENGTDTKYTTEPKKGHTHDYKS